MCPGKDSETARPATLELDELYDRGYFHGQTSGYPADGYAVSHPDWSPWLELIRLIQPSGTLVDLGCAYGYLVEEARRTGFQAFGLDISSFALRQNQDFSCFLTQADLTDLPIKDEAADVVTLFDVLEHLHSPREALDEVVRILKPDGLLVGTTPDPVYFDRSEQTHVFERPPSYWIASLEERGLKVRFRFSEAPYNFQFVASSRFSPRSEELAIFQHDFFGIREDFLKTSGELRIVPRFGWGALDRDSRQIESGKAAIYLLNLSGVPVRARIRFQLDNTPEFCTLSIRFNGLPLQEIYTDSETVSREVTLPEFLVPTGGHHVFWEITAGQAQLRVSRLEVEATASSARMLTEGLPFDLYQRYELAGQLCRILSPKTILDIGGVLGDRDGHLATSADFLQKGGVDRVETTDLRHADHPEHQPSLAWHQPFEDSSFDLVVSLDVLEHLPRGKRLPFLEELVRVARHWIILGAPTDSPRGAAFEKHLAETVMRGHGFLEEHLQHGIPKIEEVEDFFSHKANCCVHRIPNGYLLRWAILQVMTQLYFAMGDAETFRKWNSIYNRTLFCYDQRTPCYRHLWLVSKSPLSAEQIKPLEGLMQPEAGAAEALEKELVENSDFFTLHQHLHESLRRQAKYRIDVQFLINERQKLIQLLNSEVEGLRARIQYLEARPVWKTALSRLRKRWMKL